MTRTESMEIFESIWTFFQRNWCFKPLSSKLRNLNSLSIRLVIMELFDLVANISWFKLDSLNLKNFLSTIRLATS